ncbi:hypothetical protein Scep_020200 [Stephania cephalantha]|uniref:Uncharacterized protein n=1 Tax=Stephania cephalantha TaxID=152367 RepID=A0AAP0ID82_9MAGN
MAAAVGTTTSNAASQEWRDGDSNARRWRACYEDAGERNGSSGGGGKRRGGAGEVARWRRRRHARAMAAGAVNDAESDVGPIALDEGCDSTNLDDAMESYGLGAGRRCLVLDPGLMDIS